jgi:hypothetical protein
MAKRAGRKGKSQEPNGSQVTNSEEAGGGTAVAEKPKRGRRAKQQDLIPDAFERIPAIEDASEDLHDVRTKRIKMTAKETEAEDRLAEIMQKHKRDVYKYEINNVKKTAIRKHSEKDKVTIKTDDEESEED